MESLVEQYQDPYPEHIEDMSNGCKGCSLRPGSSLEADAETVGKSKQEWRGGKYMMTPKVSKILINAVQFALEDVPALDFS